MQLTVKPYHRNTAPLAGFLIRGSSAAAWIRELQLLQLSLKEVALYPVPGTAPNTVWGCLAVTQQAPDPQRIGKHEACQRIGSRLFIPERSVLHPAITLPETEKLFASGIHLFHPETGLAELTETLDTRALLQKPAERSYYVTRPAAPDFVPQHVRSFQVQPVSPEEVLSNMEKNLFPEKKKLDDKPLNVFEKLKLSFYKTLFKKKKETGKPNQAKPQKEENNAPAIEKTGFLSKLEAFFGFFSKKENEWVDRLQEDFEDLEKRNQKQLDKLLDLLRNDPVEALKYAIPLDEKGSGRGGTIAELQLSKRWSDFSLFGNSFGGATSGSVDLGDGFRQLREQYMATAQELLDKKEYHQAAFIYLKLLKNNPLAAQALEQGGHYQEAAVIYLKNMNNRSKAAECYEKGNMTQEAIALYKELGMHEKVGDLYLRLSKRKEADVYFEKVVDEHKAKDRYVKAALIYKVKMQDPARGQSLLLEGWRGNHDAYGCLSNYFADITDIKELKNEISSIHRNELNDRNRETFLQVIRHEYNKKNELSEFVRDIAYDVIATQVKKNPDSISELHNFNRSDKVIIRDTMRYKLGHKKK